MRSNNIRKATFEDFATIRNLPIQLTQRPVTALKPKHIRVMLHEAAVRHRVFQGCCAVNAFMALRFTPGIDSAIRFLVFVHFALDRHALYDNIAPELEMEATAIAREHQCQALLVCAGGLSRFVIAFFCRQGYTLEGETLIKRI